MTAKLHLTRCFSLKWKPQKQNVLTVIRRLDLRAADSNARAMSTTFTSRSAHTVVVSNYSKPSCMSYEYGIQRNSTTETVLWVCVLLNAGIPYLSANWLCRKPRTEQRCSSGVRLAHNNTWGTYTTGMMGVDNSYPLLKTSLLRDPAIGNQLLPWNRPLLRFHSQNVCNFGKRSCYIDYLQPVVVKLSNDSTSEENKTLSHTYVPYIQ
jgi:hypothetical protein